MHGRMLAKHGKTFDLDQKLAIQGMRKEDEVATVLRLNGLQGRVTPEDYTRVSALWKKVQGVDLHSGKVE